MLSCVGGFFLIILGVVVVAGLAAANNDRPYSASSTSTYSYTPPTFSTGSYPTYSPSGIETPTDLPSGTESSSGGNGGSGTAPYGEPEDNKVYQTGKMKSVGCTARLRSTSPQAYNTYVRKLMPCLNKSWKAQLAAQGISFQEPGVVISQSSNPTSPCNGGNTGYVPVAFYCSTNQTMYFSLPAVRKDTVAHAARTPAHEFGHHVQNVVGILPVYQSRWQQASDGSSAANPQQTELSRRTELQAQAFATMFLGANTSTMGFSQKFIVGGTGGDDYVEGIKTHPEYRTHGTVANNKVWLRKGWPGDASASNTWSASTSDVA